MPDSGYMDAAAVPVPDTGDERGPFRHGEGCPDEPTGRLTDQCNCGEREAVEKLLTPDAGDDTLREQLAQDIRQHCDGRIGLRYLDPYPLADALLPLIRDHVAKAAPERWWICTDALKDGGKKIHGPFGSRDLALQVRVYVEQVNDPTTYWVDREEADRG